MSLADDIADLFRDLDEAADPIIDQVLATGNDKASAALADGLALRLVQWVLGDNITATESELITTSLLTELTSLKRAFRGARATK